MGNMEKRQSNIELLRIVSMLLVMLLHVGYALTNHIHSQIDNILHVSSEAATIICVNVFVLISGWFGIKFSFKGIAKFLFQVIFLALLTFVVLVLLGKATLTIKNVWHCTFGIFSTYWFVWAYLLLYIFSPVLNSFVENNRKGLEIFLISFYIFTFYVYVTLQVDAIFFKGFHTLSFIGLYLLARYVHVYKPKWSLLPSYVDIGIYLLTVTIAIVCVLWLQNIGQKQIILTKLGSYIAPTTIVGSLFFFLAFTKFEVNSRFINWCAISSFAAYVVHQQFDARMVFNSLFIMMHNELSVCLFWPVAILVVSVIFFICVLLDKIRISCYNITSRK